MGEIWNIDAYQHNADWPKRTPDVFPFERSSASDDEGEAADQEDKDKGKSSNKDADPQ